MNIPVEEPWYKENSEAVFKKTKDGYSVFFWKCQHDIKGGECIYCALHIDDEDDNEYPED